MQCNDNKNQVEDATTTTTTTTTRIAFPIVIWLLLYSKVPFFFHLVP